MKMIKWSTIGYGLLALTVLLFALSLLVVYVAPRSVAGEFLMTRLSYPVVVVGYRGGISSRELAKNMRSIRRFYENQDFSQVGLRVDFSTDEGKKRLAVREKEVLNKMVEDQVIMYLARERDIFVSPDMAEQGVARKLEEYGSSAAVTENLERLYGWTLRDFEKKVVLPGLYEEKLNERFLKETDPVGVAKTKIEQATEALRQGSDFAKVVKQYSEGQTADEGGDLGWFAVNDLTPELRSPVSSQKVGIPGSVVESTLGFHILLVQETKRDKDNQQLYRLKQVFARKTTFADWLAKQMKGIPIWTLDRTYFYNTETARIEFRDSVWRTYEEELRKKATGDASFFF
ncbi:MAG: peptidylprolyl isomerase [Candidatus Moranbacteria bacterium]|nr:peptidylprolyl isomerase [Candidatus Moranbacteria bacterium]